MKIKVTMPVSEKTSIYFAVDCSLREIYYGTLFTCTRSCASNNDAKIACSRDAQCNTEESP